jgi:hypothetical protein
MISKDAVTVGIWLVGIGCLGISVFTHNHHLSALGAMLVYSTKSKD